MHNIRFTNYVNPEAPDRMYDVSRVKLNYDYWFFKILNILIDIFEYDNLPTGLESRDIELNLLMTGHAVFIPKPNGEINVFLTSLSGYDKNYQPTHAIWANPVINNSKTWELHKECEIVYNSRLKDYVFYLKSDASMMTFIGKYARLLADIESTIDIYIVNSRMTSIPATDDQNTAKSIKAFFRKLTLGERSIVTDSSIIPMFRNVDINKSNVADKINDWLIARDKILEMMFRDLGVRMYNPKKAQVNNEEIESNDQMLLISLDDMLKSRQEGFEAVNYMFGTDIIPKINPRFDIENYSTESSGIQEVITDE